MRNCRWLKLFVTGNNSTQFQMSEPMGIHRKTRHTWEKGGHQINSNIATGGARRTYHFMVLQVDREKLCIPSSLEVTANCYITYPPYWTSNFFTWFSDVWLLVAFLNWRNNFGDESFLLINILIIFRKMNGEQLWVGDNKTVSEKKWKRVVAIKSEFYTLTPILQMTEDWI